jgi:Histidine kinase-, DNA gyrase B-, and HSP90-like ATPase
MKVLARTRLRIRDQGELLNQIAGTYKDFFRAAMEYIDNAVDAAAALQRGREKVQPELHIQLDTLGRRLRFVDNCGGMSAQELSELLSEVGAPRKRPSLGPMDSSASAFMHFGRSQRRRRSSLAKSRDPKPK